MSNMIKLFFLQDMQWENVIECSSEKIEIIYYIKTKSGLKQVIGGNLCYCDEGYTFRNNQCESNPFKLHIKDLPTYGLTFPRIEFYFSGRVTFSP